MTTARTFVAASASVALSAAALTAVAGPSNAVAPPPTAARAVVPAAASTAAPKVVPANLFGIHSVRYVTETMPVGVSGSWRLWDSGTMWGDLQPRSDREPNWAALDAKVALGKAAGVTDFLLVIGMPPRWAASKPSAVHADYPGSSISPPADGAKYQSYVTKLARHVNTLTGTTWSFEVWNEADLGNYYAGTPERLADITAYAHRAVKSVNPKFRVISASITVRRGIGSFFNRYLAALRTATGFNGVHWPIDAYSVHPYPSGSGGPSGTAANIATFRSAVANAGAPVRPVWNTEINYGLPGPGLIAHRDIRGATAAAYLARTYLDALRTGVDRVYWYAWMPQNAYLGIVTMPGTRATTALATLNSWLRGATLTSCSGTTVHVCRFVKSGAAFRMAWTEGTTVPMALTGRTRVCAVDGTVGGSCATTTAASVRVGGVPVRLS